MKALVTGGAGFIGSHLSQSLVHMDDEVIVVDDLSTGSLENIAEISDKANFRFVKGSIRNAEVMRPLIENCDVVFHLAAAVGVNLIADRPVHTIETNIGGTEVVLVIANEFGRKVLLTSSSEVYGKSEAVPFGEDDDMLLGSTRFSRWAYACSKAIDEFLALAYHQQSGLEVVIARLFNTIGPRQSGQYGMVVPRFVQWAIRDEPILIYGTGRQSRCFSYVGDIIEGMIALVNCPDAAGKVYNLGSAEEITIEALADKIIEMTDSGSEKKFISYKQAYGRELEDMTRRVPSLERIESAIGWQPNTSLEQSLEIIINDIRSKS